MAKEKAKQWVHVLEDLYMAHLVYTEMATDAKAAGHMWKVYEERKYKRKEVKAAMSIRDEAYKRAKKERAVERDERDIQSREHKGTRERGTDREVRPKQDRVVRGDTESEKQKVRNETNLRLTKADDVWDTVPRWLKGKYITATKDDKPFKYLSLEKVAAPGYRSSRFEGKCMECGETGHKAVECTREEYKKGGKTVVPPLRLFKAGLLNEDGSVKS